MRSHAKDSMSEHSPNRICPICKKPTEERFRPFCSKRCADLDLAKWLKGDYAIAATGDDEEEEAGGDDGEPEG
jgi:endogenous inhibitor of DNA gyrase (YacG/DUF329 family)